MLQELQVDTRNKEEEVFIVTSSADLIPAYPGQVPTTDEGIPNPCLSSVGPGMQVHREAATQPRNTWSETQEEPGTNGVFCNGFAT